MGDFEIKFGGITYSCSGTHSDKENQNWNVVATIDDIRITMTVPIDKKITRSKVMLFVEAFHVAFRNAQKEQKI